MTSQSSGSAGSMAGLAGLMGGGSKSSTPMAQPPQDDDWLKMLLGMSQQFMAPALEQPAPASGVMGDLKRRLLFMDMLGRM